MAGIIDFLEFRKDLFFWRANTSAGKAQSGLFMRSGKKGQADIQGVQAIALPGTPEKDWILGRFFGIEAKRERGGKVSLDQERWGQAVVNHGGLYIVARSVEEVEAALGREQAVIPKVAERVRVYPP